MENIKLPISEDGKRLVAHFEAKLEETKQEILAELKKAAPKTTKKG